MIATLDAFATALSTLLAPISVKVGDEQLDQGTAAPRVIVSPGDEEFDGPLRSNQANAEQHVLKTRMVGVIVHLWGDSLLATEQLLSAVAVAIATAAPGAYRLVGGGLRGGRAGQAGWKYELAVELLMGLGPTHTQAVIESVPQQSEVTTALPTVGTIE